MCIPFQLSVCVHYYADARMLIQYVLEKNMPNLWSFSFIEIFQTWSIVRYIWHTESAHVGKWCPCAYVI